MPQQTSIIESDFFTYVIILVAACGIGIYMFANIPHSDIVELVLTTVEFSGVNKQKALEIAKQLPDSAFLRVMFIYVYAKALLYIKMFFVILYSYLISSIDIKTQLASTITPIIPSSGAYHMARRLIVISFVILPCTYITMPIDYYLKINIDNTRYAFAAVNALLVYYAVQMLVKNRPKVL